MGIVKRTKVTEFTILNNKALQEFKNFRPVAVLAQLMSMPSDWVISKTQLYKMYGRGPVSNGIAELEERGYWVEIMYRNGSQNLSEYFVSDIPFTDAEVSEMISGIVEKGYKIFKISTPFAHLKTEISVNKGKFVEYSTVDRQQLDSSKSDGMEQFGHNTQECPNKDQQLDPVCSTPIVEKDQLVMTSTESTDENQQLLKKEELSKQKQSKQEQRKYNKGVDHHQNNTAKALEDHNGKVRIDDEPTVNNFPTYTLPKEAKDVRLDKVREKFLVLRKRGNLLTPKDLQALENVVEFPVSTDQLLSWMDQIFQEYGPASPQKTISSMSYYEAAIRTLMDKQQGRGRAPKQETLSERLARLDRLGLLD
ncbi:hypothetical protein M3181_19075 [Mesobacillus maritimus]|uniref:hypothetical protein n=1 Tax=Mesobacillus maritimus TaxID=1643336 RepID=UPI00203E3446|nr:hypothetical protein [Mesobacillus maritimus]MCM3671066.1 hypothetical protein [Mesobacillus maritimus]